MDLDRRLRPRHRRRERPRPRHGPSPRRSRRRRHDRRSADLRRRRPRGRARRHASPPPTSPTPSRWPPRCETAAAAGPLRVVVNCAGIAPPAKVLDREGNPSPLAGFEKIIRVNLIGTYNVIAQASAVMARTEPDRGRRPRRHRQHRERRRVRRADRPARVLGEQGRRARDDAARSRASSPATASASARSPPASWRPPCSWACRRPRRTRSASRCPTRSASDAPTSTRGSCMSIVDNGYLNGETIRLDGAIRMAPK